MLIGGINMEIWRDIEGYEGLYQVSNLGRVRSLNYKRTGKVQNMKLGTYPNGYNLILRFGIIRYFLKLVA